MTDTDSQDGFSRSTKASRLPKAYDVEAREKEERNKKKKETTKEVEGFPVMMSFKAFLETQDDYITDEEALTKYGEYKLEFKRQKLNEFFVLHKNHEWFKVKYHPNEAKNKREAAQKAIKRRCDVFQELMHKGFLDGLNCDMTKEGELIKLLDSVVILLEDGNYEDIKNLDNEQNNNEQTEGNDLKHKTSSIFIKNLHPSITRSDLLNILQKYPGFLRLSISDADPANQFFRRCWVSFQRSASKIREICFALNNVQVRGLDLQPMVNRDLSKRIRPTEAKFSDPKQLVKDFEIIQEIIKFQDAQSEVWKRENPEAEGETKELKNSLLAEAEAVIPEDLEDVKAVLDKMILYLRIVHSIDYYNQTNYKGEDEMPNRCGLMHVRLSADDGDFTEAEMAKFWTTWKEKLHLNFLTKPQKVDDSEAKKLGLKDEEFEIDKFVSANSQELSKDKWLCTISGKKFKALEFVKKHIFNKFLDQVTTVKEEVEFFNNYIRDPKRPQLPEEKPRPPSNQMANPSATRKRHILDSEDNSALRSLQPQAKKSVHERLGVRAGAMPGGRNPGPDLKVTYANTDPRGLIDYSDVDSFAFDIFG